VRGGVEKGVAASHDEADYALAEDANGKCETRADEIAKEGAADCAGQVEDVDNGVPAEGFPDGGGVAKDDGEPGGGVDAEGVGGEVVDEPD